jgi:hypothetical protein
MSRQLFSDLFLGFPASPIPQLRQLSRIPLSGYDGSHHAHPRNPIDVRYRPVHSYIHLVQALLHPS